MSSSLPLGWVTLCQVLSLSPRKIQRANLFSKTLPRKLRGLIQEVARNYKLTGRHTCTHKLRWRKDKDLTAGNPAFLSGKVAISKLSIQISWTGFPPIHGKEAARSPLPFLFRASTLASPRQFHTLHIYIYPALFSYDLYPVELLLGGALAKWRS